MLGRRRQEPQEELTPEEQQREWLRKAKYKVKCEHYFMIEELKKDDLDGALRHAVLLLSELRTGRLTPKTYYNLYMLVFDKLRDLLLYFRELVKRQEDVSRLYERVQYTAEIVPRLYLVMTAGVAYIESKQVRAQNVLKDMVDICKGVQHPTRGLFLRHHLSQMTKKLIPDLDGEFGGTITESINYCLTNFQETINLYSRLKHVTDASEERERERESLQSLLGTNLVRLSQLEGCTKQVYKLRVLPAMLEILTKYQDHMAQQYCFECIIQVFPDEYHMETLESLLEAIDQLEPEVNLEPIFTSLLDRLSDFAEKYPDQVVRAAELVTTFLRIINPHSEKMHLEGLLTVKTSLLKLILEVAPDEVEAVSESLVHLAGLLADQFNRDDPNLSQIVTDLIYQPVLRYKNVITILELEGLKQIFDLLGYDKRRFIALALCDTAIRVSTPLVEAAHVEALFEYLQPLVVSEADYAPPSDADAFEHGQVQVARVVHLITHEDEDALFDLFKLVRRVFGGGGEERIRYSLPPLVFEYLRLAERMAAVRGVEAPHDDEDDMMSGGVPEDSPHTYSINDCLQYIHDILSVLANNYPEMAFNLYLKGAVTADSTHEETFVYEFLTQAFLLFEETESKNQLPLMYQIINTLISLSNLSPENFETLSAKSCRYSSKLLVKSNQCLASTLCSHMFWPCVRNPRAVNDKRALECLQWSLKVVKSCMKRDQTPLLIQMLNTYLYHFLNGNERIEIRFLAILIQFLQKLLPTYEEAEADELNMFVPLQKQYDECIRYMDLRKAEFPLLQELLSS